MYTFLVKIRNLGCVLTMKELAVLTNVNYKNSV